MENGKRKRFKNEEKLNWSQTLFLCLWFSHFSLFWIYFSCGKFFSLRNEILLSCLKNFFGKISFNLEKVCLHFHNSIHCSITEFPTLLGFSFSHPLQLVRVFHIRKIAFSHDYDKCFRIMNNEKEIPQKLW